MTDLSNPAASPSQHEVTDSKPHNAHLFSRCGLVIEVWPGYFLLREDNGAKHRIKLPTSVNACPPIVGEVWLVTGEPFSNAPVWTPETVQILAHSACMVMPSGRLIIDFMKRKIDGIDKRAESLWIHAGRMKLDLYSIMNSGDPAELAKVVDEKGRPVIPLELIRPVLRQWRLLNEGPRVMRWLQKRNFSTRFARRAWEYWGADTVNALTDNPYRLLAFAPQRKALAAFAKVDQLATSEFRVAADDPRRLMAAFESALYQEYDNGNTAATLPTLKARLDDLLGRRRSTDDHILKLARDEYGLGIFVNSDGQLLVQLAGVAYMERAITDRLMRMLEHKESYQPPLSQLNFDPKRLALLEVEEGKRLNIPGFRYNEEQRKAIEMALVQLLSILTGNPGSGKTTVINGIVNQALQQGGVVHLIAFTGKAAKRMRDTSGQKARTIVKMVGQIKAGRLRVKPGDLVLADESSMIDMATMYDLLRHLPEGCRMCFVGDPYQLPPIRAGLTFHVMAKSSLIPHVHLTEIHRQATETGIPQAALQIREITVPDLPRIKYDPKVPRLFPMDCGVYFVEAPAHEISLVITRAYRELRARSIQDKGGANRPAEVKVLSGINSASEGAAPLGVDDINTALQAVYCTGKRVLDLVYSKFYEGDPLICMKNMADRDLWNGSAGILKAIYDTPQERTYLGCEDGEIHPVKAIAEAEFDGETHYLSRSDFENIQLAYALTVHKAQGSEFDSVIIACQDWSVLENAWFYTAVTRAKRLVILVGDSHAFRKHVERAPAAFRRVIGFQMQRYSA